MNVTDAELESLGINEIRAHFKSLRVMFQQTREELLREASQEDQSFLALPDNGINTQRLRNSYRVVLVHRFQKPGTKRAPLSDLVPSSASRAMSVSSSSAVFTAE